MKTPFIRIWLLLLSCIALSLAAGCSSSSSGDHSQFTTVEIATFDSDLPAHFHINTHGQAAWTASAPDERPLYIYADGESTKITESNQYAFFPKINSNGKVVWAQVDSAGDSDLPLDIYQYENGLKQKISDGGYNFFPSLNSNGDVAWQGIADEESPNGWDVFLYNAESNVNTNISAAGRVHEVMPQLNDKNQIYALKSKETGFGLVTASASTGLGAPTVTNSGKVAFNATLFEKGLYVDNRKINANGDIVFEDESKNIFLVLGGITIQITGDFPGSPTSNEFSEINDAGQVVFEGYDGSDSHIYLYDGGKLRKISQRYTANRYPHINNSGQVVWQGETSLGLQKVFLYDQGYVTQLGKDGVHHIQPQISDEGSIVWMVSEDSDKGLRYRGISLATTTPPSSVQTVHLAAVKHRIVPGAIGRTLQTAVPTYGENTTKFTFLVFGDSRGDDSSFLNLDEPQANFDFITFMVNKVYSDFNPAFVIFLGDMGTRGGLIPGITTVFDDWITVVKPIYDTNMLFMAKGNHELYTLLTLNHSSYWYQNQFVYTLLFSYLPDNGLPGYEKLDYSFVYGNTYFMFLDTFYCWDKLDLEVLGYAGLYGDLTEDQMGWIKGQMNSDEVATATHRFVISHAPIYSDEGVNPTNYLLLLSQWMDDNKFDFYYGAHEHLYSRRVMDNTISKYTLTNYKNNVVHVITGGGGAHVDDINNIKVDMKDFHVNLALNFVIVEVDGDKVTSKAYRVTENPNPTGPDEKYIYDLTPFDTIVKIGTSATATP